MQKIDPTRMRRVYFKSSTKKPNPLEELMARFTQKQYDAFTASQKQESLSKSNTSAPRKYKLKSDEPEAIIQEFVEKYCELKGHICLHIPNGVYAMMGNSAVPSWVKGQITDYLGGVPDTFIFKKEKFSSNLDCIDNSVLIMELKTPTGKLGPKQKKWRQGLVVHVPRSIKECLKLLQAFEG